MASNAFAVDELSEFFISGAGSGLRDSPLVDVLDSDIFKAWLDERRPSTSGGASSGSARPTSGQRKRTATRAADDRADGSSTSKRRRLDASVRTHELAFDGSTVERDCSVSASPPPAPPPLPMDPALAAVLTKVKRQDRRGLVRDRRVATPVDRPRRHVQLARTVHQPNPVRYTLVEWRI